MPSPRSSRITDVVRSLAELSEPIRVSGTSSAARAWLVLQLVPALRRPLVVFCADDDSAADLAGDLETFSRELGGHELSVRLFPAWEQSPYSPIQPSIRTRLSRAAALAALASSEPPAVLITTLPAACQATIPREELLRRTVSVRAEDSVESREDLVSRLVEAGYLRVDPVEDPGTFAVRGDIVDVFPPGRGRPVRIELFGDVVERIREFDPATQRASGEGVAALGQVSLPPAREVLINRDTAPGVRERLKARADDLGIPRLVRDPVLAQISDGIYPEHSDAWAPFAFSRVETLWDHLPEGALHIWDDELGGLQSWDAFMENERTLAAESATSEVIAPAPEALYPRGPDTVPRPRLYLDRVELADLESLPESLEEGPEGGPPPAETERISARQRVFVRPNQDLVSGAGHSLAALEPKFKLWQRQGFRIVAIASGEGALERVRFLLEERKLVCRRASDPELAAPHGRHPITLAVGSLSEGFRWPAEGLVVLTEGELLGASHARKVSRKPETESGSAAKSWSGLQALSDLAVGDAVVHVDHGIGRYLGISRLDLSGAPADFLLLEYANRDKLYLPVYRLNVIQRYIGGSEGLQLDKLGAKKFAETKEKVRDAVKKLAFDLLQLYAQRKVRPGVRFSGRDGIFSEFEGKFPFDETPDQLKAIDDVLEDLRSGKVMDRLVCGDVGYGKTEVAIRAAFRAVTDGKQVAVLVPTTVLAFQHEQSFKTRFKDYPLTVESVSRFKSAKEQKALLEKVAKGQVDVIIGTHRLLSRDVEFRDLGLVIVDEEHRFGVEHKEKLKTLKVDTHVLTLTATPIPRTLHMALSGLRDISLINTPPVDRLPIRTYVSKRDDSLVQRAIDLELRRGGQVFFVHNRVQTIHEVARRVRELVPSAQVSVGHGQMSEGELEKTMLEFYQKKSNVLVCTTIIESGLDVPSANTILIDRADALGLAQLYQIRGRVGRAQNRAYAYLLIPAEGAVSADAKRRLEVIQRFVELGSGFSVASHDLEIRGGGDILGPQQSGHIQAVGFDLYMELLDEAIREAEGKPAESAQREPEIKAPFPAYLSEEYVPDVHQRLSLYRRFSAATKEPELDLLEEELRDRFGALPVEALNLMWVIRVKILLKRTGVDALTVGPEKVSLTPGPASRLDPARAIALVAGHPGEFQLTPDSRFVARVPTGSLRDLYFSLEKLIDRLAPA
jgi:transcription-repair coupling factor (superfamily II helicase)